MAQIDLEAVRIGFAWVAEIQFPTGFLAVDESVTMKLRRYAGAEESFDCSDERVGDSITLSLTGDQTADMTPGTYVGEAIVYQPAAVDSDYTPLTRNRYVVECDYSPSE